VDDDKNDALGWANYSLAAHPAEAQRMAELVPNASRAAAYLAFGLRPMGSMDRDPYGQPIGQMKPWAPETGDFSSEPILVDTMTGWRFRVDTSGTTLRLDLQGTDNFIEAQELLARAEHKKSAFAFKSTRIPAVHELAPTDGSDFAFPVVRPIELHADTREELERHVDDLGELFCGQLPAKRLWFRGQRQEYLLRRDARISHQLYGRSLPSLTPSLQRYAKQNPERMNYGFAIAGPNNQWNKPFMVWLMRQNKHWFDNDARFLPLIERVLADGEDAHFAELLMKIQMSPLQIGEPPHLDWPDEADDLRQWFFAFMRKRPFAITLQQYGYYTSLLDLTEDLDVALYFTQASIDEHQLMRCAPPKPGRVIYVFAESRGGFYHHGNELFWGSDGWLRELPPRLSLQKAGFIQGASNRTQNFYGIMIVAQITLGPNEPLTNLVDTDLFPPESDDLLYATLRASRPVLESLY
jgi:hypothetical protein